MRYARPASRMLAGSLPVTLPFVFAYSFVLVGLVQQWADDPNYAHGFFVPFMAAYLARRRWARFLAAPRRPSAAGIVLVVAGSLVYLAGVLGAELFTMRASLIIVLAGILLALEGPERLRVMAFPIAFMLFMIPLPYVIYYRLTFPLQLESSRMAAAVLTAAGLPVVREGNVLHLEGYSLEVVTACSGLRSIMSLGAIGVFLADLFRMRPAGLLLYTVLIVPVAMAANVARLVVTAVLATLAGQETAESFLHELSGVVLFVTGVLSLVLIAGVIRWIERRRSGRPA